MAKWILLTKTYVIKVCYFTTINVWSIWSINKLTPSPARCTRLQIKSLDQSYTHSDNSRCQVIFFSVVLFFMILFIWFI